ncbi:hypothetical protein [Microcoleus sp. CAWBG640]|uniref:hypothetical protein n=1 Tax=Microcoleus sp. CAWBG640 TaxID=2841653 RepID=UPI00312BA166
MDNTSDLEYILTLDASETADSKASLVRDFIESKHSIAEYGTFFYWLANELDKGEIQFKDLIFDELRLTKTKALLLSTWLLRLVV